MNVLLIGAPGSGKGTQGQRLAARLGLRHIATGDILRQQIADQTELGRQVTGYLDRGELVPDEVVIDMVLPLIAEAAAATATCSTVSPARSSRPSGSAPSSPVSARRRMPPSTSTRRPMYSSAAARAGPDRGTQRRHRRDHRQSAASVRRRHPTAGGLLPQPRTAARRRREYRPRRGHRTDHFCLRLCALEKVHSAPRSGPAQRKAGAYGSSHTSR